MKKLKLKLTTKTVSVKSKRIIANVTVEQIEDLEFTGLSSDLIDKEFTHMLQEEERKLKRKNRKEKIKEIFGDEIDKS